MNNNYVERFNDMLVTLKEVSCEIGAVPEEKWPDLWKLLHKVNKTIARAEPHEYINMARFSPGHEKKPCEDCGLAPEHEIHKGGKCP